MSFSNQNKIEIFDLKLAEENLNSSSSSFGPGSTSKLGQSMKSNYSMQVEVKMPRNPDQPNNIALNFAECPVLKQ